MSINYVQVEFKEEEIVHQLKEAMDIEQWNSLPFDVGKEEAINEYVFH